MSEKPVELVRLENHHFERADRAARVHWAHYQEIMTLRVGSMLIATTWDELDRDQRDALRQAMNAVLALSPKGDEK